MVIDRKEKTEEREKEREGERERKREGRGKEGRREGGSEEEEEEPAQRKTCLSGQRTRKRVIQEYKNIWIIQNLLQPNNTEKNCCPTSTSASKSHIESIDTHPGQAVTTCLHSLFLGYMLKEA